MVRGKRSSRQAPFPAFRLYRRPNGLTIETRLGFAATFQRATKLVRGAYLQTGMRCTDVKRRRSRRTTYCCSWGWLLSHGPPSVLPGWHCGLVSRKFRPSAASPWLFRTTRALRRPATATTARSRSPTWARGPRQRSRRFVARPRWRRSGEGDPPSPPGFSLRASTDPGGLPRPRRRTATLKLQIVRSLQAA